MELPGHLEFYKPHFEKYGSDVSTPGRRQEEAAKGGPYKVQLLEHKGNLVTEDGQPISVWDAVRLYGPGVGQL